MMPEQIASELTEKALRTLERKISNVYTRAGKDIEEKLQSHLNRFTDADKAKRASVDAGTLSATEYKKWRLEQMATGDRWKDMRDTLAADYSHANEIAASLMRDSTIDCYALNHNYAAYAIEKETNMNLSFSLYDHKTVERLLKDDPNLLPQPKVNIPLDQRWNQQKITGQITAGILTGDSIPNIAKRLQSVTNMNRVSALCNARTATTGAENAGRIDSYNEAEKKGVNLHKEWLATLDGRTRHSHAVLDGEKRSNDEPFSNGCMYPGDPNGLPEEIYNCRCTLIAAVDGVEDIAKSVGEYQPRMTYSEWEKSKITEETKTLDEDFKKGIPEIEGKNDVSSAFDKMSDAEKENWYNFQEKTNYELHEKAEGAIENYDPRSGSVTLFDNSTADTYFHETAHSIDKDSVTTTNTFEGKRKRVGSNEWVDTRSEPYEFKGASNAADNIYRFNDNAFDEDMNAIYKWSGMKDEDDLQSLIDSIRTFEKEHGKTAASVLSDMIDAQTLGKYPLSMVSGGHGEAYWKSNADKAAAEAWAEYTSLKAQGLNDAISAISDILPNRIKSNEIVYNVVFGGEEYVHEIVTETSTRISKETWKFKRP